MKKSQLLLFYCFVFLAVSCHGRDENAGFQDSSAISRLRGKVTGSLACLDDKNIQYALYLPSGYDASRSWPLLVAFDSHGDGRLPAGLLAEQAETHGCIVAGSNNSKNGLSLDVTAGYFDAMLNDLTARFNIDRNRVYTMGFSGGARVAVYQALRRGGVRGAIGCGAGFPSQISVPASSFIFLGVVGKDDFNLAEMKQLMSSLDQTGIPHHLLVYDGAHAWPAGKTLGDIFCWIQLRDMKDGLIPADSVLIDAVRADLDRRIGQAAGEKRWTDALDLYSLASGLFEGYPRGLDYRVAEGRFRQRPEVLEAVNERDHMLEKEEELQGYYLKQLGSRDPGWWKEESGRLRAKTGPGKTGEEAHLYRRLLGYLSLACYLNARSALTQQQADPFRYFATVYGMVDPANAETAYLMAVSHMMDKQEEEALESLRQAADLGFRDANRLRSDTVFRSLMRNPEMEKLLVRMK